jgi:hypothetical protein
VKSLRTLNLASGTAIVGAFRRAAAIYRKNAVRIDLSEPHADFFVKNLTAIRAEQHELLAVFKPLGFCLVTGVGIQTTQPPRERPRTRAEKRRTLLMRS